MLPRLTALLPPNHTRRRRKKESSSIARFTYTQKLYTTRANLHVLTPTAQAAMDPTRSAPLGNTIEETTRTMNSSSKYFETEIWSPRPFRLLVFNTRSRASACPDAGSRGRSLILVSVGSPVSGNTFNHRIFSENKCTGTHPAQSTSGQTPASRTLGPALQYAGPSRSR